MIKKVLLITNIPNPYRIPLFNELNKQLQNKDILFKVIFGASGYSRRKWHIDFNDFHFDYEILSSRIVKFFSQEKIMFTYPRLFKKINQFNPDVVITNAFSIASTKLWIKSFFIKKKPYIIWSGAIDRPGEPENVLRRFHRRALIKKASGFISYGTRAKIYLTKLGAPESKINIAFNTVDTEFFANETEKIKKNLISDEKKHILYVGHFTKGKRVNLLLKIIKQINYLRKDIILDLVGTGPEEANLKKLSINLGIESHVMFHGFCQKSNIPYFFAQADCFLFPSEYDVWGLVLVEAMAAGVPCFVSHEAGAVTDLIIDNETGFVFDFNNTSSIIVKIIHVINDLKIAKKISKNAAELIKQKINIKSSAESFVKTIIGMKC